MATPWWAKVSADYYKRPSTLAAAIAPRARKMAAVIADTHLRDEPQLAGAFLKANVPYSVAQRAARQYQVVKDQTTSTILNKAGVPNQITNQQQKAISPPPTQPPEETGNWWSDAWNNFGKVNDTIGSAIGGLPVVGDTISNAFDSAQGVGKSAANAVLGGMNAAFSPIQVPISMWLANNGQQQFDTGKAVLDTVDKSIDPGPMPSITGENRFLGDATTTAMAAGWGPATALGQFFGWIPLSPGQQDDMHRAGYDPNSFASRYAWYYDDMEAGQRAVSDDDIRLFSQEYDPQKVQAVREIITSNALNDGQTDALSPQTQAFIQGLQGESADKRDTELFTRMTHSATLRPGGVVSDLLGLDRGTESSQVASAFGDLAFYWFTDPTAVAAKGIQSYRAAARGVSAGSLASLENKIVAVVDPNDLSSATATVLGRNMDDLLKATDQVHVLTSTKFHSPEAQIRAGNEASKIFDRFVLKHPDMVNQWDVVAKARAGKLEFIKPKQGPELEAAMQRAANGETYDPVFMKYRDKPGTPLFVLDHSDPKTLQRTLNEARGEIASRMSTYIWHDAVAQGRPLIGPGILLMPGEVALNRRVRAFLAPVRDKMFGVDNRLFDVVNAKTGMPNVKFDQTFDKLSDMFVGRPGGQWSAAQYTSKWAPTMEKLLSRIGNTYSGRAIPLEGPESLETIRRMAVSMFGRRYGESIAIKWAQSGPAERNGLLDQFHEAFAEAAMFKTNPQGRLIYDMMSKSMRPDLDQPWRVANEVYTANKADNEIKVGQRHAAAGVWDYQMSRGTIAPDFRVIRDAQQKTGLLSFLTGLYNHRILNTPTALWKVGKVGNPANMGRQAGEGYGMLAGDQGLRALTDAALVNRRFVAGETIKGRRETVQLGQAANKILNNADTADIQDLERFANLSDWTNYRSKLEAIGTSIAGRHGLTAEQVNAIAHLSEGVKIEDLAAGKAGVFFGGLIDPVRRTRLQWQRLTGVKDPWIKNPYHQHLDTEFQDALLKNALGEFGHAADNALLLQGQTVAQELAGAARLGVGGTPSRIPNSRQWLGAQGDAGAINWFKEFDSRQTDILGGEVMRALAIQARHGGTATIADIMNHAANQTARARNGVLPETMPSHLNTAEDVARWLLTDSQAGERFRQTAARLAYDDNGGRIRSQAQQVTQWDAAIDRAAQVQLRDAAAHMGAKIDPQTGSFSWDTAYNPMLDNLALGGRVKLDDLHAIDDSVRPVEISAPLYVPNIGQVSGKSIVNAASKLYSFTVARPLQRLMINPVFMANKNVAMRHMSPIADELMSRGLNAREAAAFLESAATKYAVGSTFRYTDMVAERSFFSEITGNFLMFQRASEDFIKRFMKVTSANPQILSRGYLLMEAANHSGMIYPGPPEDDDNGDGELKQHLIFTFPGSELMAQGVQNVGRALGWGDDDLIKRALYSSMSSQVRYVNPSLSNPFGFSTSPLLGMPLRIIRAYFPETDKPITNTLARIEGGGERFFAEQDPISSLLPTPLARLVPALTQNETDGQLASAVRNAFIYFGAAGLMPGPDATADEIEDAHDSIKAMATNQLVWRAVVGTFSPWAPQYDEPETGMPEVNVFDQARGINSLRGEWFDILGQMSKKYGAESAFGQAATEWFRRHPDGQSIVSPTAFQVGTTDNPGSAGNAPNANSGPLLSQWMLSNRDWLLSHKSVAYYLLPNFAEAQFSSQGMRDQIRFQLREHKDGQEFYSDLRYQIGMREYWQHVDQRSRDLAGGRDKQRVYDEFDKWEQGWRIAHPATAVEKDRRMSPEYVKGTLAPSLQQMVENPGPLPSGVDLTYAKAIWQHYSDYQVKYNRTVSGDKGKYDRAHLNKEYRNDGDKQFLGTPGETLWKAMDIYEDGS